MWQWGAVQWSREYGKMPQVSRVNVFPAVLLPVLWIGYSFLQHAQLPEGTFAQLKTLCSEAGNVALNPLRMLRQLKQGLVPCSTLPTWPLGREDRNTAVSAESAQQVLSLVWHSPCSRLIKGNGYPDAHTRMFAQTTKPQQPEKFSWKEEVPTKAG